MKNKRFMKVLITSILAFSLFATPVFADGQLAVRETEPNDTMENADDMWFNIPYYYGINIFGTVNNSVDTEDWFKVGFNAEDSGYSKVDANIFFEGTPNASYEVTILDSNGNWRGYKLVESGSEMSLYDMLVNDQDYLYFHIKHKEGTPILPYRIRIFVNDLF